jgi:hypothetical protein
MGTLIQNNFFIKNRPTLLYYRIDIIVTVSCFQENSHTVFFILWHFFNFYIFCKKLQKVISAKAREKNIASVGLY